MLGCWACLVRPARCECSMSAAAQAGTKSQQPACQLRPWAATSVARTCHWSFLRPREHGRREACSLAAGQRRQVAIPHGKLRRRNLLGDAGARDRRRASAPGAPTGGPGWRQARNIRARGRNGTTALEALPTGSPRAGRAPAHLPARGVACEAQGRRVAAGCGPPSSCLRVGLLAAGRGLRRRRSTTLARSNMAEVAHFSRGPNAVV